MEKKIEDYLHLYLGCDIQYQWHEDIITTNLSARFISECVGSLACSNIKPLLRPLSSMTEEEYAQCAMIVFQKDGIKNIKTSAILGEGIIRYGIKPDSVIGCFELTKYLLSKHFDLFNLIPDGLAIDKSKI